MQEKLQEKLPAAAFWCTLLATACFAWLSYLSIRLAYADFLFRAKTLPSMARATRVDPGNATYYVWLGELLESEGHNPDEALRTATILNPRDSFAWMRRGFRAEIEGDYAGAERFLLEAARVDRQFDPRWTLMNYYFRRGDLPHFWIWTRKALEMSYGDLTAIFGLCRKATQDSEEIRRALPPGAPILSGFVRFLLAEDRVEDAAAAAVDLAAYGRAADAPLLVSCCEKALQQGRVPRALALWNAMCERKLAPGPRLAPAQGSVLTNGAFGTAPLLAGFDWHIPDDPEITAVQTDAGLNLSLSGHQPEACDLVWQYVPLAPGERYRFRFQFQTSGAAPQSGLRWRLAALPVGKRVLLESAWLASDEWKQQELTFSSQDATLGRLALTYERALGTTRLEGSVMLRNLAIELAP